MDYLVTHIRRDRGDLDRRIDMLMGPSFGPSHIDTVIADIRFGLHTYFVTTGPGIGQNAAIEIRQHPLSGRLFLQTAPDGLFDNNLYALPEI